MTHPWWKSNVALCLYCVAAVAVYTAMAPYRLWVAALLGLALLALLAWVCLVLYVRAIKSSEGEG